MLKALHNKLTTKSPKPIYSAMEETPGTRKPPRNTVSDQASPDTLLQLLRLLYGGRGCPLTTDKMIHRHALGGAIHHPVKLHLSQISTQEPRIFKLGK